MTRPRVRRIHKRVSKTGVTLIKGYEGYVGHPYQDSVGVWTIGYGHTEGVTAHSAHLTETQASELLAKDLDESYAPAVTGTGVKLTQHEFDALVSFVYNLGVGMMAAGAHVGHLLRFGTKRQVADSLLRYDHAGNVRLLGLTRRREAERALFLS